MSEQNGTSHAVIDESVTSRQELTGFQAMLRTQPFWVFMAILAIGVVMSFVSDVFLTERNLFNITRNFAFFGIMALGMSAVICTAGIDLSVGSLMALSGIVLGLVMQAGYGIELGFLACMLTAAAVGFVNGMLVAYVRLAPFVVTLGMLAIARSLAMVVSNNKMIYEFGPDQDLFEWIGGESMLGVPNVVWVLIIMTILFWWIWRYSTWGPLGVGHRRQCRCGQALGHSGRTRGRLSLHGLFAVHRAGRIHVRRLHRVCYEWHWRFAGIERHCGFSHWRRQPHGRRCLCARRPDWRGAYGTHSQFTVACRDR